MVRRFITAAWPIRPNRHRNLEGVWVTLVTTAMSTWAIGIGAIL